MRVLLTTPYPMSSVTGVGSFVRLMAACLRGKGDEPMVIGPPDASGRPRLASVVLAIRSARILLRRRGEVDVVHCQQLHVQSLAAGTIARVLGKGVVLTVHGRSPRPRGLRGVVFRIVERIAVALPHRLVVVAHDLNRQLGGRALVVPVGVSVETIRGFREERESIRRELGVDNSFVILYSGRVTVDKGIWTLLDAFDSVFNSSAPAMRLVLVGPVDANVSDRLQRHAAVPGSRILILGPRSDALRLLSAADLFVLASTREGLPFSLLEAMAARLPVIATRVGDVPEVVHPEETGLLIPPGDANALAEAIRWILVHPQESTALGLRAGALVAARYEAASMCAAYSALYAEVSR